MSIMPHNTAPATSATGTPAPIAGAGAAARVGAVGMASATDTAPMKNAVADVKNLIPASGTVSDIAQCDE
jgi:hypothetical protein